jgi:arsenate reductase
MRILILCTGNSCRSQMAEGFLKSFDPDLEVFSAGTLPSDSVHPNAIRAMKESGIDIGSNVPESVDKYLGKSFDFVITVCGGAKESCPAFTGNVKHRLHIGFDDPAEASGSDDEVMAVFRRVRDEIKRDFHRFYIEQIKESGYDHH